MLLKEDRISLSIQAPLSTRCQPARSMNSSGHLQVQLQGYAFRCSLESSENMGLRERWPWLPLLTASEQPDLVLGTQWRPQLLGADAPLTAMQNQN